MAERSDLSIAHECIRRATTDVEVWLALVEQGQLATVSPFGQMFVYQLKRLEKLGDKKFAVDELYKLYYRKAGGKGLPPVYGGQDLMSLILSRSELMDVVLREIRRHEGCEGVSAVAILEKTRHLPSAANWEISIVVAENGDPAAVQLATAKVQALLQVHHRLAGNESPRGNKKTPPE